MPNYKEKTQLISKDELRSLRKPSNMRALFVLALNWALIVSAFAIVIIWPNPVTILLTIVLLGGRQLGLGILTHDCSHNAFFSSIGANNFAGHWLCGAPINLSVYEYRIYHMKHHRYAGTEQDPDRSFVENYPVTRASLKRKIIRDLTGQTGFRDTLAKLKAFKFAKNYPWLLFHTFLFAVLLLVGAPWAYLLWWAAEIFVYPLLTRIRQVAEHGVAIDRSNLDARENTGTTLANWWERLVIAPNRVNFHVEHHQFPSVPSYNLPQLHKILVSRNYFKEFDCIADGYWDVLKRAVQPS